MCLIIFLSLLLGGTVNLLLKEVFRHPLPPAIAAVSNTWSFPSGHAQLASNFIMIFLAELSKRTNKRLIIYILAPLLFFLLFVNCFGIIFLGYHYIKDVIAGACVGFFTAFYISRQGNFILSLRNLKNYLFCFSFLFFLVSNTIPKNSGHYLMLAFYYLCFGFFISLFSFKGYKKMLVQFFKND